MKIKVLDLENPSRKPDFATQKAEEDLGDREHKQILEGRDEFKRLIFGLCQAWVGFLIVITVCQFSLKIFGLGLTEKEFITVFGTATAGIFAFMSIIGRFLFSEKSLQKR